MAESAVLILLVDDDEVKRYTIARVLKREGFAVLEAATGQEGLERAAEQPDLIVLDVHLPDVSGLDVCRRLKSDPATATIPVLHLSAVYVKSSDRAHGLDSGADGYLAQSVDPSELLATIRALLRAKHAEEAASRAARGWQTTFDSIRDGICLLDLQSRIVRYNRGLPAMVGTDQRDLTGEHLCDLIPINPCADHMAVADVLEMVGEEPLELQHGEMWLRVTADPIYDDHGRTDGAVCVISDLTERKEMEEELRQRAGELVEAHRRKDEFLAMLAHELRNPLAPIRNAATLLGAGDLTQDVAVETSATLERQVDHLSRLVDDLLDVSRIMRGKIELRREAVELNTVVARAVESAQPLIESERHTLTVTMPAEPIWVDADAVRLAQVLSNLLNNAAKYMEPGGRIELIVAREPKGVSIRVIDQGVGIGAELLPHVFDLFVQAESSIERSQGGLGIGLTLVKNLVEMHDGTVAVHSDGAGRGSEFIVRLPVIADQSRESADIFKPVVTRQLRVLVIEDNVGAAKVLARMISRFWGYETRIAHEGPSALETAEEFFPHVVLCDIGLPGMSGFEVAKQLRERLNPQRTLLVALTGYGAEEDRKKSADVGFDEHLVKPAGVESLQVLFSHPKLSTEAE